MFGLSVCSRGLVGSGGENPSPGRAYVRQYSKVSFFCGQLRQLRMLFASSPEEGLP